MSSLIAVYTKFGEAAEAAQLLETEIGNLLLNDLIGGTNAPNEEEIRAGVALLTKINKSTMGSLIKTLDLDDPASAELSGALDSALEARNHLCHSFYREHNHRRNSDEGCAIMMSELERLHELIFDAYRKLHFHQGVDLDALAAENTPLPKEHRPI